MPCEPNERSPHGHSEKGIQEEFLRKQEQLEDRREEESVIFEKFFVAETRRQKVGCEEVGCEEVHSKEIFCKEIDCKEIDGEEIDGEKVVSAKSGREATRCEEGGEARSGETIGSKEADAERIVVASIVSTDRNCRPQWWQGRLTRYGEAKCSDTGGFVRQRVDVEPKDLRALSEQERERRHVSARIVFGSSSVERNAKERTGLRQRVTRHHRRDPRPLLRPARSFCGLDREPPLG